MTANHAIELFPGGSHPDKEFSPKEGLSTRTAPRERIKIVGVGGGGNNALNHIIRNGITDVEFLGVNTDMRSLENCLAQDKIVLGEKLTRGLGAGARPDIGMQAAVESREDIRARLKDCNMVYLAAGMGGGTGTGATPVIAQIARELGILTVAVVTRPFSFEGRRKKQYADDGIAKLGDIVDALLVVQNDRLLELSERTTLLSDAFAMADNILRQAVKGVTDLVTRAGVINVDFADLRNIMQHAGPAVMGVGSASGERRLEEALSRAMESPLMECSMQGAKGVLFNITSGPEMGIIEVQQAAEQLHRHIDPDANYIWGWVQDESIGDSVQAVVIATGFDRAQSLAYDRAAKPAVRAEPALKTPIQPAEPSGAETGLFSGDRGEYDSPTYMRRREVKA